MHQYVNYEIKLDYPSYENKEFNNKIQNYINEKEDDFKASIKDYPNDKNYDFIVNYTEDRYQNIISIHFIILAYTGGAHYERMDEIFYYDEKKQKEVQISEIINNNKYFYEYLSKIAKKELKKNNSSLIFEDELLNIGLEPKEENFKYLIFTKEGLKIIFPPYQVGPWSSGELSIIIPYEKLDSFLKQ